MSSPQVFKPDKEYFDNLAAKIVRRSEVDPSEIQSVEINCGNAPYLGFVILKSGDRVRV